MPAMNRKFQRSARRFSMSSIVRPIAFDLAAPFRPLPVAPNVLSNFFSRSVSLKCVGDLNES